MGHGISFFKQYDDDSIYLLFKHKSLFVGFTEGNLLFDCFKGHILSDILKNRCRECPDSDVDRTHPDINPDSPASPATG